MPTKLVNFSFNENISAKATHNFIKTIDSDLYKDICDYYKTESITPEILTKIFEDLKKDEIHDRYGKHDRLLSDIIEAFIDNEKENIFSFYTVDEDWTPEGADEYVFYSYVDDSNIIDNAIVEIEKQLEILKSHGKKVTFKYE